ncbi:MAG: DUF1127 domain-containing protein [Rhizobiaceae bacterium]|jgi:uncharacterized protein YjiS (DUF1127 family)
MSTLEHAAPSATEAPRPAVLVRVFQSVSIYLRALKNRREIYRLGAMTDLELADIGLTRTDLHVAVRSPLGVDPTACLGSIVSAREDAARRVC